MNIEIQTGLEKSYADEMIALVNEQGGSEASEAYIRGYEDGYDQACMDLTDDDLGSCRDDQVTRVRIHERGRQACIQKGLSVEVRK